MTDAGLLIVGQGPRLENCLGRRTAEQMPGIGALGVTMLRAMRVLVAPDSFKGSLSSIQAAEAMATGVRLAQPDAEIDLCPLGDGGEGTLNVLSRARGARMKKATVCGPTGEPREAPIAFFDPQPSRGGIGVQVPTSELVLPRPDESLALIEMATVSGLSLVEVSRRDPASTSTYGLGELICAAADAGATVIVVALGGSATCDAGIGMAQAMGATFDGVPSCATGKDLEHVSRVELAKLEKRFENTRFVALCDVDHPLVGPEGAARTFAPQKGASPEIVERLERGLRHYAEVLFEHRKAAKGDSLRKTDISKSGSYPGDGAAGGVGFAMRQLLNAELVSGIDWVLQVVDFERRLAQADRVITGEGLLDETSLRGKVISGVSRCCRSAAVPMDVVVGDSRLDDSALAQLGVVRLARLLERARDADDAHTHARELLADAARRLILA